MNVIYLPVAAARHHSMIDAAIAAHGPIPVLRAALRALLPRRRGRRRILQLPDHLRRDVGLPPLTCAPIRPPFV